LLSLQAYAKRLHAAQPNVRKLLDFQGFAHIAQPSATRSRRCCEMHARAAWRANTEKKGICAHPKHQKVLAYARWCAIFRGDRHTRGNARDDTTFEE
jgi:hypothetical protein